MRAKYLPLHILAFTSIMAMCISNVAAGGAIQGTVYTRNHLGDYRATGWANITVTGGPLIHSAQSHVDGSYQIYLPAGTYTITAELPGYKPSTATVSVSEGSFTTLNFYLEESGVPIPEFTDYLRPTFISMVLILLVMVKRKIVSKN
ncbi:carboxypeptidase regulatory-like domain-containing protein [Candidatus Bathyarchaeota archaeon]|nr:carboxypeptidase regulatory-like domain-containing protein [Candidatus Bathyarchaeota archaeon]MBS7629288.1 carboxypeptidase regulatory-like domain-containing protein [Candidatus Bathyarchaeota archaeon]